MFPNGVIYDSRKSRSSGVKRIAANLFEKIAFSSLRGIGAGFIAFFVLWLLFSTYPIISNEVSYVSNNLTLKPSETDIQEQYLLEAQTTTQIQQEAALYGVGSYFSLVIPKIEAKSNIIANVDPANESEYFEALKDGVAHAKGTFFPGQGKSIYLFAHSTDYAFNVSTYNAVFYLLRKLEVGDEITVFFADKKFTYVVSESVITNPDDVSWLTRNFGKEKLILQTCYPPGTRLKRLLVIADLK